MPFDAFDVAVQLVRSLMNPAVAIARNDLANQVWRAAASDAARGLAPSNDQVRGRAGTPGCILMP
jgi:hypothetical protein